MKITRTFKDNLNFIKIFVYWVIIENFIKFALFSILRIFIDKIIRF